VKETIDIEEIKKHSGFVYLASPYSKYPAGIDVAFREVCKAAGWLVKQGISVYCPIAMTHSVAVEADLPKCDHDLWMPCDKPFMEAAFGLIMLMMPSWNKSVGMRMERDCFTDQDKPIWFLKWPRPKED
jgi:hypothetical protein